MGTCLECGALAVIVNHTPASGRQLEEGYLGRHHRRGTRAGTKCRGSFGSWSEKKRPK